MRHPLHTAAALATVALAAACTHPTIVRPVDDVRAVRADIARERSLRADTLSVRTLGVTPLRVSATDTAVAPLAFGLADIMMTDLARSSQLRIVDRIRLNTLLTELQLVSAGRVDSATAPRVGRIVGARRLVLGDLASAPNNGFSIDARIADVVDGTVRPAVSASAPLNDILAAEKQLVFRLFDQLGVTLSPAERTTISERATGDLAALLAYGRAVRYEVEGRFDGAEDEYRNAIRIDPAFQLAQQRLRELQQLRRDRAAASLAGNDHTVDALLQVLGHVSRFDLPIPAGGRGAGDPSFPLTTGTLIIIIRAQP
ncbi:MAG: CsgG/HfaB family protein [Gemmatimonadaceae bacterium]